MEDEALDVLEELTSRSKERPVLVGGSAVDLYTAGMYTTGDIDLVGSFEEVSGILLSMGFEREGRFFVRGRVFIDLVGSRLYGRFSEIRIKGRKTRIRVISVEDILVDRMCASKFWRSSTDREQAKLLWDVYRDRIDRDYLSIRAREENVLDVLEGL